MKSLIIILITILLLTVSYSAEDNQVPDSTLIRYLKHENDGLRSSAAQLLGERGSKLAFEPLIQLLKVEHHPGIRVIASLALWKIGENKALPVLRSLAKKDKDKMVRKVAKNIIMRMRNN